MILSIQFGNKISCWKGKEEGAITTAVNWQLPVLQPRPRSKRSRVEKLYNKEIRKELVLVLNCGWVGVKMPKLFSENVYMVYLTILS